jgi:hypothetical protein
MIWTTYLDFVFEDDGGTSERMGTWRPAFICTPFALAGSHAQPSEVNLSGCFHLDNSCRRSTCETHEYMCIAGSLGPLLLSPALRTVSKHVPQPDGTKQSKAAKWTESIAARFALVIKSGKYTLGYKSALKQMRSGKGLSSSVALRLGLEPRLRRSLC